MKVLKRNGQMQDFNLDKIKTTLICTANDLKQPLNNSDINNLSEEIEKVINGNFVNEISSKEIHFIVIEILDAMGFSLLAKAYNEFENSFI